MSHARIIKKPWTKGEKFLLGAILLTVALAGIIGLWWNRTSAEPVVTVPTPVMPARNAFDVLLKAAAAVTPDADDALLAGKSLFPSPGQAPRVFTPADKAVIAQANAPAMALLHQGLSLPYENPPIRSFLAPLPYYAKFRHLARLTTLVGQVRMAQGDWYGAFGSGLDSMALGAKIPHDAPLIGDLVGIACEAIGRKPLWGEVDHLTAPQARAAARRLEGIIASRVPYAAILQQDEWTGQSELMELFRRPDWRTQMRDISRSAEYEEFDSTGGPTLAKQAQMLVISKRTIMDDYTRHMDELRLEAAQPYATRTVRMAPTDAVVDAMTGVLGTKARFKDVYTIAEDNLLLVPLALHAYRLEHGTYPLTLNALVPAYLTRIPEDPFALVGPLHYKRQGSTYLLYSVGPDGKDDGGTPAVSPSYANHSYVSDDSQGDIVAGVNP